MAYSTLFPLPIAASQLKRHFTGLGDVLQAVACYSGQDEEAILEEHVRASLPELELATGMPFFVTRYCTEEVAARPSGSADPFAPPLVLGTDYDRTLEPLDYIVDDWQQGVGRVKVPYRPIGEVLLYRFTFAAGGHIVDLPLTWLNFQKTRGTISLMPHGLGISSTQYFRLLLLFPFYRGSPAGTIIPHLVHLRYTAGLVEAGLGTDTPYGAEQAVAPQQPTRWDQGLVKSYQRMIGLHASAPILRELASEIDKGGASISFAGLSATVNPGVLKERADQNESRALDLAETLRQRIQGPLFVTT